MAAGARAVSLFQGLLGLAAAVEAGRIVKRLWDERERRRRCRIEGEGAGRWARRIGTILAVGDSITEEGAYKGGWTAELQEAFSRRADVLNRGFSGYTTRLFLRIAGDVLATLPVARLEDVAAVTVMFGANDSARPGDWQHVPEVEFADNMRAILRCFRSRFSNAEVIVLSPPHVDPVAWGAKCRANGWGDGGGRSAERATCYGKLAQQAALECGCCFVDVRAAMVAATSSDESDLAALLSDGLHLSPSGNEVVYKAVMKALQSRGLGPSSVPMFFPGMPTAFAVDL